MTRRRVRDSAVRELDAPHLPGGRWSPEAVEYPIRRLVQMALQFAPGLLIVSETLGEEAFELLKAATAGCGFGTTLHANSAQLGMQSLVTAALMAGENVPERVVRTTSWCARAASHWSSGLVRSPSPRRARPRPWRRRC